MVDKTPAIEDLYISDDELDDFINQLNVEKAS